MSGLAVARDVGIDVGLQVSGSPLSKEGQYVNASVCLSERECVTNSLLHASGTLLWKLSHTELRNLHIFLFLSPITLSITVVVLVNEWFIRPGGLIWIILTSFFLSLNLHSLGGRNECMQTEEPFTLTTVRTLIC